MISVIVPFYNSEPWLDRCCRSLAEQSGDFDFIMVDDFSTDRGREIVRNWCGLDPRFCLLTNWHSKGVSGARNTGLDYATQEPGWITFLDADDELLPKAWRTFQSVIASDPSAVVHQMNHMRYYTATDRLVLKYTNEAGIYRINSLPQMWFGVWNKLYRSEFVKEIRFDERLQYGEDGLFNLECFAACAYIHHGERGLTAVKHRFDNKQSLSKSKDANGLLKQVHAYEEFLVRQTDPEIRAVTCKELSKLWGSKTYERCMRDIGPVTE